MKKKQIKKNLLLNQCARELLLAQSSDWLFIITNGTMVDYAKKKELKTILVVFTKLYYQLKDDNIDVQFLKKQFQNKTVFFQKLIICFIFNYFVAFNILYN